MIIIGTNTKKEIDRSKESEGAKRKDVSFSDEFKVSSDHKRQYYNLSHK